MGVKRSIVFFLLGIGVLAGLNSSLEEADRELVGKGYRGREGMTQGTVAARLMGAKRAGAGILWVKQVVVVGENLGIEDVEMATKAIAEGSEKISYLDPYFEGNYQFSGSILAFIRTYRRFDLAFDIFKRGLEYNPESEILKKYMAGALASSRGNILEILVIFEEIVAETRDDLLINTLAFTYEQAYENTRNEEFLKRSLYYWSMLIDSKDERYRTRAGEKIEKYSGNQ